MLTKAQILSFGDLEIKKVKVPEKMGKWSGQEFFIRQLTRGDQDDFLKRKFGGNKVAPGGATGFDVAGLYGHDSWIVARGVCDEQGQKLFSDEDVAALNEKSGSFIGWLANEILVFSEMKEDAEAAEKLNKLKEELKN